MAKLRFPSPHHDHRACLARSLERARAVYRARGSRLTALREAILRELADSHAALGAYDIIERLRTHGRRVSPISVYRVLDSLLAAGLAHRLESRNAFVACHAPHAGERTVLFLVCEDCGTVAECPAPELDAALGEAADSADFGLSATVLEASGQCAYCAR